MFALMFGDPRIGEHPCAIGGLLERGGGAQHIIEQIGIVIGGILHGTPMLSQYELAPAGGHEQIDARPIHARRIAEHERNRHTHGQKWCHAPPKDLTSQQKRAHRAAVECC